MPMRPQPLAMPWWITLCIDGEPVTEPTAARADGTAEMHIVKAKSGWPTWRAVNADGALMVELPGAVPLLLTEGCCIRFPGFVMS